MNFLEKLDILMKERGLNKHTFSEQCGIPYNTILSWYKKGYDGIAMSKLIIIADFFDVELDFLMRDSESDRHAKHGKISLPSDENDLLGCYRSCNDIGQSVIRDTAHVCADNPVLQKRSTSKSAI